MADESFLLVSLEEDKAKKLAQVLTNDTSRKILDQLSKEEHATETELSKSLKIPLSTVHYNMKHLVEANLVSGEIFTYSEKGKEVTHYKLSNKFVIIAPKKTTGLREKFRSILPAALILGSASIAIKWLLRPMQELSGVVANSGIQVMKAEAAGAAADLAMESTRAIPMVYSSQVPQPIPDPNLALWFLFGGVFALLVHLIWTMVFKRR